jgi:hypothetical protein
MSDHEQTGTYQIELPEDDVIGAIAALTLYAKDTPLEEEYKSIAGSIEHQARDQGLTHPVEEDDEQVGNQPGDRDE